MPTVIILLPLLAMVVFGAVIGIIVWAFTRPRKPVQPLAAPPHAEPGAPAPVSSAWPSGRWNTKVTKAGALTKLGAQTGVLTLWEGRLALTLSGAEAPEWVVPCNQLRVSRLSMFTTSGAALKLEGEFGAIDVAVSQEHINIFMENDAKYIRERGYARELARMLAASGSR